MERKKKSRETMPKLIVPLTLGLLTALAVVPAAECRLPGQQPTAKSRASDQDKTSDATEDSKPSKGSNLESDDKKSKDQEESQRLMERLEAKLKQQEEDLELLRLFARSLAEIEKSYVQKVDRRRLIEAAIDGMLHDLDRYSDFIPPEEMKEFETDIESEYGGIGIRVTQLPDEDYLTVTTPIFGSPSYKAGVVANTWIVDIDGKSAQNFSVENAVDAIQGEIGSIVKVTFRNKQSLKDQTLEIPRAVVKVQTVLGDQRLPSDEWDYFLRHFAKPNEKIAYLRISNFGRQTVKELKLVLADLIRKDMKGLILDLRFNPGGLLTAAIDTSDLFVDQGLIVRTEGRNAIPRKWFAKKRGTLTGFPIAVIVNDRSASASEIVAACLKDSGRAVIVGERTFGKGSVQNMVRLEKGKSILKLTTAAYYRPNGQNINRLAEHTPDDPWGVKPSPGYLVDFDDEMQQEYFRYRQARDVIQPKGKMPEAQPEFKDLQLERAVEYLRETISKANSPQEAAK